MWTTGVASRLQFGELAAVCGLTPLFPMLRFILDRWAFQPLAARIFLRGQGKVSPVPQSLQSKVEKFKEANWKFLCYGFFLVMGVCSTMQQPWFGHSKQLWEDWPHHTPSAGVRTMYACQLAYYIATTYMLACWEVPRKDYPVMMTHHFATMVLIAVSYVYRYTRVGCVIMLLHDACDVLMEVAKMFNYLNWEAASTTVFLTFTGAWVGLRLYYFPLCIIRSALFEVEEVLGYKPPFYWQLNTLLIGLVALNVYWFGLILQVLWMALTQKRITDVREDED